MRPRRQEAVIFKRKPTYLMEISAEMYFQLEKLRAESEAFAALPEDDQRALCAESIIRQVMEVAREELERHEQKPKRSIKGGGHEQETGAEIMVNEAGEHWVDFSVAFEGDYEGAAGAVQSWAGRVETFGGIAQIGRVSLRGTDGTNQHAFSDEIEALAAGLDENTRARIDELMDPSRGDDV